jgi:hypothetical protein
MRLSDFIRRVPRIPHKIYWEIRSWIFPIPNVIRLWLLNHYSQMPVTHPTGVVVSLTSYGARIRCVYLAIESIGQGSLRPSRIILWLDEQAVYDNPPATIRRLLQRGLELKLCENYGPHKKYYPYLQSLQSFDAPLVTADDDVLYPRNWLKELAQAFRDFPEAVNCHKARTMVLSEQGIGKYEHWKLVKSTKPTFNHVATGVAGVIYPPEFLAWLKRAGAEFVDRCLKADDLWLHVQAVRAGFKIRQIHPRPLTLLSIPGAESVGLWKSNIFGGNDRQIARTYNAEDIQKLYVMQE